jgi:hypothetical protein
MRTASYIVIILISVILLAEVYLRVTGKYRVFSEMNGRSFYTEYGQHNDTWFHTRPPNDTFVSTGPDFHYRYIINNLGFRDKIYDTLKSSSTYRILVTGDSFAEGEGSPYDSTWPRTMEKYLRENGIHAEVIDAGVAGSDIIYDYVFYRDKLKQFHPDLVIASLNSSDYQDYITRGGMERFKKDGTTQYRPAPWYLFFYRHSLFARALLHKLCGFNITGLFLSYYDYNKSVDSTDMVFSKIFCDYKKEAENNGAGFIAVIQTIPIEIKSPQIDICQTDNRGLNNLAVMLNSQGVRCLNLSGPLYQKFSPMPMEAICYPHDLHYTPMAYAYTGKIMADSLIQNMLIK